MLIAKGFEKVRKGKRVNKKVERQLGGAGKSVHESGWETTIIKGERGKADEFTRGR